VQISTLPTATFATIGKMAWITLLVAGLLEIVWAIGLKYTQGFTRLEPTFITVGAMIVSMGLLGLAVRTLPIGTAYAVWTGIGTVGTVLVGIAALGESASPVRLLCVALIVIGIIGLKLIPQA
jgi:quaternary ammonium compound-resistance protein SugE